MSFESHATQGNPFGTFRAGIVYGALWAIGSSWSTALREVARVVFPDDAMDVVFAELLAAGITTVFGVTIAILAAHMCDSRPPPPPHIPPPLTNTRRR